MPDPIPNPADVDQLVAVLELEAAAAAAMLASGFPPDLTRAPNAAEVASKTAFAKLEREIAASTRQLQQLALEARGKALQLVLADLAQAGDVAAQLDRIDALAAALYPLEGAAQVAADARQAAYARVLNGARTGMLRFITDAAKTAVTVPVPDLSGNALVILEEQARRLAAEAIATATRAVRLAAYTTPRQLEPQAYHKAITRASRDVGTKALEDVAQQVALRAHGVGRMEAVRSTPIGSVRLYASELLDRNTCAPCASIDGQSMTEAEADQLYPDGQYVGCLGGGRCRGTVVAVSTGEDVADLAVPGDTEE